MIVWLKFLHIATIAVWCAGLICLPGLYVQRGLVADSAALYRLQGMVRFAYVSVVSPAAFLAVGSGIGLIFAVGTFELWFSMKLLFVGCLVAMHIVTGLVIIRLFEEGENYSVWRFAAATAATLVFTLGILFFVLAKPRMDMPEGGVFGPGALREIFGSLIPWTIS